MRRATPFPTLLLGFAVACTTGSPGDQPEGDDVADDEGTAGGTVGQAGRGGGGGGRAGSGGSAAMSNGGAAAGSSGQGGGAGQGGSAGQGSSAGQGGRAGAGQGGSAGAAQGGAAGSSTGGTAGMNAGGQAGGGAGGTSVPAGPWKFLFVGNSFTFNSGVAGKTKELVNRGQKAVSIATAELSVNWFRGLYYHWNNGANVDGGNTRALIKARTYTHVALQDFMLQVDDKSQPNPTTGEGPYGLAIATDYGKRFIDEVKANGQVPVVWAIWPEQTKQTGWEALIVAYKKIAEANGAVFVPASAAWYLALKERPNLALWDADRFHPSPMGGYACACVFYAVLTGQSPVGNVYVSDNIDADTARFLQEKAWQAYQTYGSKQK